MAVLDQSVFKSEVIIDRDLNIKSADSSFYRFINCLETKNISEFLDSFDNQYLLGLSSRLTEPKSCVLNFHVRGVFKECVCELLPGESGSVKLSLYDYSGLIEKFSKLNMTVRKGISILSMIDVLFFDLDIKELRVLISSGRSLETLKEFDLKDFKNEFADYLGVDPKNRTLARLVSDLSSETFMKEYNFEDYNILTTGIYDESSNLVNIIGVINNRTKKIQTRSFYNLDGLTQILNKKAIMDLAIAQIETAKKDTTLVVIDIDYFKSINDNYGHLFGDDVLIKAARIIKEAVGDAGNVGRFGGDEFLVVLKTTEEVKIRDILRNIKLGIQWAYSAEMKNFIITCSIGGARFPMDAEKYEDVFNLADKCLYIAKQKGRNCYIIYSPEKHDKIIVTKDDLDRSNVYSKNLENSIHKYVNVISSYTTCSTDEIIKMLCGAIEADRATVYCNNEIIVGTSSKDINPRKDYLQKDYYRHFKKTGIMVNDNINQYEVVDKDYFTMYYNARIVGSLEVSFEQNNKNYLICFDKIGKEHTKAWHESDVSFALMVITLIKEKL